MNYILCFVYNGLCYFTSQSLDKQWGDDWNDKPYEHNAGAPYTVDYDEELIDDKGEVYFKAIDFKTVYVRENHRCSILEPCDGFVNSPYSVEDINNGNVPWLRLDYSLGNGEEGHKDIFAGISYDDFLREVSEANASIYVPYKDE